MKRMSAAEIIEKCCGFTKQSDVVKALQQNCDNLILTLLKGMFDPNVVWDLPEGAPPYKKSPGLDDQGNLYRESRKLYLFVKDGNPNLTKIRRENLFIQFLEGLHPKDAEFVIAMKDKKSPFKMLTKKTVEEAFPGLISEKKDGKEESQ